MTSTSATRTPLTIDLQPTEERRARSYGVVAESVLVFRVQGPRVHNPSFPHRVQVWSNLDRPNLRNGQPVAYGQYGIVDGGNGRYLDPNNRATDQPFTVLLVAEPVVISRMASDHQYADQVLSIGDTVHLVDPDGSVSAAFTVTGRTLSDPELLPAS